MGDNKNTNSMKTRDRILLTSLDLFNLCGEPQVTTIDIANEMEISPGNLYYHFRNKEEIVFELFQTFERNILDVLQPPDDPGVEMIDYWMFVHLVFEKIWEFRFLYKDTATILERHSKIQRKFQRILQRKKHCCGQIIELLQQSKAITISPAETERLADNVVIMGTFWLNYQHIKQLNVELCSEDLGLGVHQVMSLFIPYLSQESREMLAAVAETYLGSEVASMP